MAKLLTTVVVSCYCKCRGPVFDTQCKCLLYN